MRVLLAALLLAPVLGGCLSVAEDVDAARPAAAALSEARFAALPGESVWIASSEDGTRLHTRLFLPEADPSWKAPTILVMSPYFGYDAREETTDASSAPDYYRYRWLIDHFVPRGYAVAFSDVRGTGDSGGCLEQTATLQKQDGYDVVEWLAAQEWSNGRVGMFGKSYDAETQQATATLAPPHLVTIVPVSSVSGQYEYSYYDGVPYTAQTLVSNFFYMATDGLQPPTTAEGAAQYPTRAGCHPAMLAQGADSSGDWNEFWEAREFRKQAEQVQASVLYVHGLQDWNVKPVAIRDWLDRIPAPKRAILGQWAHDYPEENRHREEWSRTDWRETVHRWYDHWLLGLDNGVMDALPPVQVQDTAGVWRRESEFPPADAAPLTLHLSPGALTRDPPAAFEPMGLRENEEAWARDNLGAPVPSQDSGEFEDVLAFSSDPLAEDLHFSGWPTLALDLAMTEITTRRSEADAHLAAILLAVAPDGTETWVNRGYLSLRHREGVENPQPVPVDEPLSVEIRFFPSDVVVPAGHALKLTLAGSDDWTQPEGSLWAAWVASGTLTIPEIRRDWDAVRLDVPFGEPCRAVEC